MKIFLITFIVSLQLNTFSQTLTKQNHAINIAIRTLKNDKNFTCSKQHIEDFLHENQIKNDKLASFSVDEIVELSDKFYTFLNN